MTDLEEYAKKHWKSVVLCKECKWYQDDYGDCPMMFWEYVNNSEWVAYDNAEENGWCYKGDRK